MRLCRKKRGQLLPEAQLFQLPATAYNTQYQNSNKMLYAVTQLKNLTPVGVKGFSVREADRAN